MLVNMFFPVTGSLAGSPRPGRETVQRIIAPHVPARLRIEPNTANLIEAVRTVGRFPRCVGRGDGPPLVRIPDSRSPGAGSARTSWRAEPELIE